jgi:orotate phosphoribosyltransferase
VSANKGAVQNRRALIARLKELEVAQRGSFVLRSGQKSDFYLVIKRAFGDPRALDLMVEELGGIINGSANCVAASGYGVFL